MPKDIEVASTIKIQSTFRGFFTRKRYKINPIPLNLLEDYPVLIQGNDPQIKGLPRHKKNENIALIGTSGMHSVEIACRLSAGTPKIIIIDNSKQVVDFWRLARKIMLESNTSARFIDELKENVKKTGCSNSILIESDFAYLDWLFRRFEFSRLKKIISNVTIIGQSWSDKNTLLALKNVLVRIGIDTIYAYPSNIVAYVNRHINDDHGNKILNNIYELNPKMAIHTNLDYYKRAPTQYFLVDNHTPSSVKDSLIAPFSVFAVPCTSPSLKKKIKNDENDAITQTL